jgi:hypothetical protein
VEERLVYLALDPSEAVHATEVMDAVHRPPSPLRCRTQSIARLSSVTYETGS